MADEVDDVTMTIMSEIIIPELAPRIKKIIEKSKGIKAVGVFRKEEAEKLDQMMDQQKAKLLEFLGKK